MQHECKITVLETKVFSELQEKYLAAPHSGACPCIKAGDTFHLKRMPIPFKVSIQFKVS